MAKTARTAAEATPKGFEGVDAIMKSEPGAMMDAVKTVKEVAPEAPYELIAQEDSPTPRAESYAQEMVEEEMLPEDHMELPTEETVFTDADIIEHEKRGKELEKFFQKELEKAQKAVAKLSAKSPMKKVIRAAKPGAKPDTGGDSSDEDKKD